MAVVKALANPTYLGLAKACAGDKQTESRQPVKPGGSKIAPRAGLFSQVLQDLAVLSHLPLERGMMKTRDF